MHSTEADGAGRRITAAAAAGIVIAASSPADACKLLSDER
jgi:hypothetical protein